MPTLNRQDTAAVERYNRFVKGSPFGGATQDTCWATVKKEWIPEGVYLESAAGEIIAAMSFLVKKLPFGGSMVYATRGPVCDVYDLGTVQKLIAEADGIVKKHRAAFLRFDPEVVLDPKLEELYTKAGFVVRNSAFGKDDLIQPRYNMVLALKDFDEEELHKTFSEKTRYNVRLAARKGVTVRCSRSPEDLKIFYELNLITVKRDKIGTRKLDYFESMLEAFGENELRIYIAEHEGEALSAAIAINYGKKMWYIYGASSNEKRNLMPNYLMQWEMIKWALECGCELYDFGGVFILNKENGLFKFKEGFCRKDGTTELIGEIDKVYKKGVYWLVVKLVPAFQGFKRKIKNLIRR